MKKSFAMLKIYDTLSAGETISLMEIEDLFHTNRRTCFRYIHDIKEYLDVYHPDKDIHYNRKKHSFHLIDRDPHDVVAFHDEDEVAE